MKILLYSINYAPEEVGIGPYSEGVAKAFVEAGHEVRVICSKPYYPHWKLFDGFRPGLVRTTVEGGATIHRCAHYIPEEPTGLKRVLHHLTFALFSLIPGLRAVFGWRPDVVMAVAPSLIAAPVARAIALLSGARFWLHVQDLEVEAAQATGLLPAGGLAADLADRFERMVLKSAHAISSISPAMCDKIRSKGVDPERVLELRNWAEIDHIRPTSRDTNLRREWGLGDRKVALYSGNIANKQGLGTVIAAARQLEDRDDTVFVICGDGPNKINLERQAEGARNILFKPLQPRERLGELLATADLFLLPQLADAADLVLPSKLTNMLAAGRPVIATAAPGTGLYDEVIGAGLCPLPEDVAGLREALVFALDNDDWRAQTGKVAHERALERWSRPVLLDRYVELGTALAETDKPALAIT